MDETRVEIEMRIVRARDVQSDDVVRVDGAWRRVVIANEFAEWNDSSLPSQVDRDRLDWLLTLRDMEIRRVRDGAAERLVVPKDGVLLVEPDDDYAYVHEARFSGELDQFETITLLLTTRGHTVLTYPSPEAHGVNGGFRGHTAAIIPSYTPIEVQFERRVRAPA